MKREIVKIYKNKSNGQLLINVPKKSDFKCGEYVELVPLPNQPTEEKDD